MNRKLISALALCLCFITSNAQQQDKLLGILKNELKYNYEQLQKQPVKPYFMSYRAEDVYKGAVSSSFGTTQVSDDNRTRTITPQIRVGDKTLDNYKFESQGMPSRDGRSASTTTIPFDDNAVKGITTNIWSSTLRRYNFAVASYDKAKSQAATTSADEDKAPCFSDAKAEQYYEQPYDLDRMKLDRAIWQKRLDEVSAVFKADPSLTQGSAMIDYEVSRTYLVTTEGTEVAQNRRTARIMLSVSAMADDGMALPLSQDFFAFSPDSLPSQDVLIAAANDLLKRVEALRKAPIANPYTGPAILSGPASGVFFHEIFGHRLEGHRLKKGGETFKSMVGKSVLPKAFQVYCDPTLEKYAGQDLNGHYIYDGEGVKARRVDNVVNGELKEFLMSRVPLDGFPQSNGHGRVSGGNDPVSRQSNLIVETTSAYTDAQLRSMLLKEVKKQGKEYGYYFKTVTSGFTLTGDGGSINSFNVTPVEVFRIYADGRADELVRGVTLIGTPLAMFSHIVAGGDTPATFTGSCGAESGWVPVTATSPAIFVSQIETQRTEKAQTVPCILPAPAFTASADKTADETIFSAMKDEIKRTTDSLSIQGLPTPFWASYIYNRSRSFDITGELGGLSASHVSPEKGSAMIHLMTGNFKRSSDIAGQPLILGTAEMMGIDYTSLRRMFWQASDMAYKNAINIQAQKQQYFNQYPLPASLEKLPDLQRSAPVSYTAEETAKYDIDMPRLENIAKELSAIFKEYPHLFATQVKISGDQLVSYRSTSENVNLKLPHDNIVITASASFKDENRVAISDALTLSYQNPSEIPSLDELKKMVRKFADDCMATRNAPNMPEYYKGPILFEDEAVKEVFSSNFLTGDQFYGQPAMQENPKSLGQKLGKKIMDERISIQNLTALKDYKGTPVYGHYDIDADGFKPETEMTIVDKGVFKMMLNRTTPAPYAEKSTASARLANDPARAVTMTGIGTLHITATGTTKDDKMVGALIKAAKKQKLDYAYIISNPEHYTSLRLYQVNLKTGERTLVKTNQLMLPTLNDLKKLTAISDREIVSNSVSPYTSTVIYPASIIIGEAELNTPTMKPGKVDEIAYPLLRK